MPDPTTPPPKAEPAKPVGLSEAQRIVLLVDSEARRSSHSVVHRFADGLKKRILAEFPTPKA